MAKVVLEGNADAVEFCPNNSYLHILAAASYTLQEGQPQVAAPPVRMGGLHLFSAKQEPGEHLSSTVVLTQLYHQQTSGVFDIKWRPYDDGPPCLAQASADGSLHLHTLREDQTHGSWSTEDVETARLEFCEMARTHVSTSMCLYVDWNPTSSNSQLALSHSDGSISIVSLGKSEPEISASWQAHDFEAWIVSYDLWKPQILYSGGDDSHFCGWDLREDPGHVVFQDKKTHKMGVCSIQSNPLRDHILVTGSYDEKIRLWDSRMMQKPLMKAEMGLGGGVWRLKWHHSDRDLILAACMHNGFAIACVGEEEIEVLEEYKEHASLAYGASWFRGDWEDAPNITTNVPHAHGVDVTSGGILLSDRAPSKYVSGHDAAYLSRDVKEGRPRLKASELTEEHGSEDSSVVDFRKLDIDSTLPNQLRKKRAENSRGMKNLVATCSFYDKALHLWLPKTLAFSKVT